MGGHNRTCTLEPDMSDARNGAWRVECSCGWADEGQHSRLQGAVDTHEMHVMGLL